MKNPPATFYIVRHGETEWNTKKLYQGHKDSPLTEIGKQQAEKLGKKFAPIHFDHVFSSDLLRAKRTAELIAWDKKLAVNITNLLRERAFGKYEGKSHQVFQTENEQLIKQYEALSEEEQHKFKYADDMESNEELTSRLLRFLRATAITYEGKTILVVTHGGVIRSLLRHLGHEMAKGMIGNTGYVKLRSDGLEFEIQEIEGITI